MSTVHRGICKLCRTDADLQWSHYLGRAFYKLFTEGNDKPILVSPSRIRQTQFQIADYLLCRDCERRFSKNGENYAMTIVNRKNGFKMIDLIRANFISRSTPDYTIYRADDMGLNTDALAYFALSIIWRSTHVWPTEDGFAVGGTDLGIHQERIRRYLMGIDRFPVGVVVKMSVATDTLTQNHLDFPRPSPEQTDATAFTFVARGLVFDVVIGDPLPQYVYGNCCVQSPERLIFVGDFHRFTMYDHMLCRQMAEIDPKLLTR